jgi:hypothetical protein
VTITREQVADLQPGDVVALSCTAWAPGTVIRGPVWIGSLSKTPHIGPIDLAMAWGEHAALTVVSRASRPLYVNHPRTEPVPGDVAAIPDAVEIVKGWRATWAWSRDGQWIGTVTGRPIAGEMPTSLRLLVDGETGMTVPS